MELLVLLLVIGVVVFGAQKVAARRRQAELESREAAELAAVRTVTEEDVTRFGEELQQLDSDMLTEQLDQAAPTRCRWWTGRARG